MKYQTRAPIEYEATFGLFRCLIPAGTPVEVATNLPTLAGNGLQFWVMGWDDMGDEAASWGRNYGFLLGEDDVEELCICAACEGFY
ncbi:hypothetical protein LCGC14_1036470 [marine sediment metagenome]|uniref:Uncharacterized protein n=1 Tax=marine sediment metagenome TaxID=412755 RepID=A0A0F9QBA7_9ZZZZ